MLFYILVEDVRQDGIGEDSSTYSFGFAANSLASAHYTSFSLFLHSTSNTIEVFDDGLILHTYYTTKCRFHLAVYVS